MTMTMTIDNSRLVVVHMKTVIFRNSDSPVTIVLYAKHPYLLYD